mmetsp:Transcript_57220/g.63924  ORF Transcript_57220/g.63924 Transcript_57220/m.63924 type:complete len:196 (-) Transcript_57220:218-805(-)
MGNCFGLSYNSPPPPTSPPSATTPLPSKKQRKEQPYVTDEVVAIRNEANACHEKLVQCAKESQDFYQKGDKKKAHTLSEQKKNWKKRQDDTNKKAANLILQSQHWKIDGEIDLHGLYLNEAIDATRDFLKHWSKKYNNLNDRKTIVLIITGAGNHSENHKAVIRPKVEQLLQQLDYIYRSVHGNGAFEVTLKPSQ